MVTTADLLQIVYDELKVIVTDETSISDADPHVGVLNRTKDIETPFFGFEYTLNAISRGMGGNVRVRKVQTDTNGDVTGVIKARDYEMILDIGVVVDGDHPRRRDNYMTAVQEHFAEYVDDPPLLDGDVNSLEESIVEPSPGTFANRDTTSRLTYNIEYAATMQKDLPTAETVDWSVDADGVDAYPENYN
jgi:hypothetical protein